MGRAFDISKYAAGIRNRGAPPARARDIESITSEILQLKRDAGSAILGIGDRLIEAKALLPHGEWLSWLTERVEFSESTAQRFMRLAREWRNPSALTDLGATKALTLLALPPEEREQFMAENHIVDGGEKTVIDMTSRELEKAIRERDEAKRAAEAAQAEAMAAGQSRAKMEADMAVLKQLHEAAQKAEAQAREELETARAELKALREKPVDVAVETVVDQEAVEKARAEAAAEMQAKVDKAEAALAEARAWLAEDSDVLMFEILLRQTQEQAAKLRGLLVKIQDRHDSGVAAKLRMELLALADTVREGVT